MSHWTIEVEYLLPVYKTVTVAAPTLTQACKKAIAKCENDWGGQEYDYTCSTAPYVNTVVKGKHDNCHNAMSGGADSEMIPAKFGREVIVRQLSLNLPE